MPTRTPVGLDKVSTVLWRERRLLELLLFRLEEEQLLLAAGRTRWLAAATTDVELVLEEIRSTELARAVLVDETANALGLPPAPSLRALAQAAPDPWGEILEDHRQAFLDLTDEIVGFAQTNRELVTRGQEAANDLLRTLQGSSLDLYGPRVDLVGDRRTEALIVDEAL